MRKKHIILLFIIGIAIFFRFFQITSVPPGLYPDEAMNGNNALEAIATKDFKVFYPENNGREGLFINIQSLAIRAFGNEPWALRSVSGLFGILTVLGIYFLGSALFKTYPNIALFASFFTATAFWHINFSRIGFRAIMAPFFFVWALFFLIKALNAVRLNFKLSALFAFLGGLFLGGGLHSYIAYRVTPLIILLVFVFFIKECGWRNIFKIFGIFLIGALITASPLLIYFLNSPQDFFGRTGQISVFNSPEPIKDLASNTITTLLMFNVVGDYNWRHHISGIPLLSFPLGIFFLIGIAYGIFLLFKKKKLGETEMKRGVMIFFSSFVIALLPIVISNEGIPHALRAILLVPPVMIISGIGAHIFFQLMFAVFKNKTLVPKTIFAITIAVLILGGYKDYFLKWGRNPEVSGAFNSNYVQIGREINSLSVDVPKYVVVEAGGTLVREIPMPTQTVMFVTDSFREEGRRKKNINYITPEKSQSIPIGEKVFLIK